ncbi:MAG: hypothetical protein L6Q33_00950 [Bacteriovoracaceae bacterium]|jgi:hypothetical protein|nr:hypothetical protein [Bacteriovoracaceae bacterium]
MRQKVLIVFATFASINNSFALSAVNIACPVKFLGTVVEVRELSSSQFPKVSVTIRSDEIQKGSVSETVTLEVLRDGPVKFQPYKKYVVEMNDGYLCQAQSID